MPRIRGSAIWSCRRFWAAPTSEQCIILCPRVSVWRLQRTHRVSGMPLLFRETSVAVVKQRLLAWRKSRRAFKFSGMVLSRSCITSPRTFRLLPPESCLDASEVMSGVFLDRGGPGGLVEQGEGVGEVSVGLDWGSVDVPCQVSL
eukprot:605054-Rhodomonas_salina.1